MANVIGCRQRLKALRCQAGAQAETLVALGEVLATEAEDNRRRDHVERLRDLRSRVSREVEEARRMESSASYSFAQARITGGLVGFVAGALGAALADSRGRPLQVGARLAKDQLERSEPFGTVLVMVRPGHPVDEARVVPVSCLARESGKREAGVRTSLEAGGNLLMTPETFCKAIEELQDRVLRGIVALPVTAASLEPGRKDRGAVPHARPRQDVGTAPIPLPSVRWRKG